MLIVQQYQSTQTPSSKTQVCCEDVLQLQEERVLEELLWMSQFGTVMLGKVQVPGVQEYPWGSLKDEHAGHAFQNNSQKATQRRAWGRL